MLNYLNFLVYNYTSKPLKISTIESIIAIQSQDPYIVSIKHTLYRKRVDHSEKVKDHFLKIESRYYLFKGILVDRPTGQILVPTPVARKIVEACHLFYNKEDKYHVPRSTIKKELNKLHISNIEHYIQETIEGCICQKHINK